jgi:hypothetical protein
VSSSTSDALRRSGEGLLTLLGMLALAPFLMLLDLLKVIAWLLRLLARPVRAWRRWRMVPLPQKNMTRATFGGFVVPRRTKER